MLKPNQKNYRYNQTLGKTGNNFLKGTKGLGGIGAAINISYSVVEFYNYCYVNGGTNWAFGPKVVLNFLMTGVGFIGLVGFAVNTTYFLIDTATDGFGGLGIPPQ